MNNEGEGMTWTTNDVCRELLVIQGLSNKAGGHFIAGQMKEFDDTLTEIVSRVERLRLLRQNNEMEHYGQH